MLAAQAVWSITTTSAVYDEPTYLAYARDAHAQGSLSYWAEKGVAPLPLFIEYTIPTVFPAPLVKSITVARACALILVGIPLVVFFWWSLARETAAAAAAGGAMWLALSPNIVANVSLATTDACFVLASLIALTALRAFVDAPSTRTFLLLAGGVSLALGSKYSGVFLFAVVPLAWVAARVRTDSTANAIRGAIVSAAGITAALLVVTFVMVWVMHGFAMAPADLIALGRPRVPAPLAGFIFQVQHQRGGHFAFLLGALSTTGWWYYTPVAMFLKSTPAELIVFAAALAALATGWRSCGTTGLVARIAFLVYVALSLVSRVDAGVRYVLVLIPLALVIASEHWLRERERLSPRALTIVLAVVVMQAVSALQIAPHYLSYFNRLVGGPAVGYRYLADSNVDWGQDLPALRDTLARVGARQPALTYFGTAPPDAYGVVATGWAWGHPTPPGPFDWIAISTTLLDGVYVGDAFAAFRAIEPSDRAAYSILLYDLARPDARQAFETTAAKLRQ